MDGFAPGIFPVMTYLRTSRSRAFTLIEVLVSVLVFFILAGGIFGAISASTTASAEIATSQLDASRMDAFQRFVRNFFLNLPGGATVDLRIKQWAGKGDVVQLLVTPAPGIASFGGQPSRFDGVVLGAIPDGAGAYRISMTTYDPELQPEAIDAALQKAQWIPLLPDVTTLRWRFLRGPGAELEETWDAGRGRPVLVSLSLLRNRADEVEMQFWIPPVPPPAEVTAPDEVPDDAAGTPPADGNTPPPPNQEVSP